ncbi:MAG TPA: DUF4350 domain-containing protein [Candidatus Methylomirabilis sp.]
MRGSRAEWIVLSALLAVMVGAAALGGGRGAEEDREAAPDPSTYNARGSGSKGLYLWLQALGLRVRRWERPLLEMPADATVLLVLGPRIPLEEAELKALEEWVQGGGVLLLGDDTVGAPMPGVWAGAPALHFGLRPSAGGRPATLRPAFPARYVEGVESVRLEGRVRFQRRAPPGWAPLFADEAGDALAIKRLDRGTLIALADPGIFSNARLETAGHARLALNIVLAHAGKGTVLVDEFHHGHGHQGAFARYLRGTAVPWMMAQAVLAFLALLLARGTRFGPPVPPPREVRASSLEYVAALGDLYQRAGARRIAAEALAASFRRGLTEAVGARPGEDASRLAARAARRLGVKEERVQACLAPDPGVAASDEALVTFAGAVHRLEGRLGRTPPGGAAGGGAPAG